MIAHRATDLAVKLCVREPLGVIDLLKPAPMHGRLFELTEPFEHAGGP